jgi:RNA polymerase sigma-70 factor (ECF subfamily)
MRERLVERAMGGDQAAFSSLAADAVDGCYRLAYRILRDPHRAQDATQQALLGAWRDLPTLRDPSRFEAWLHRLVVHACYSEARSDRRWVARVRALPNDTALEPDVARSVAARDELEVAFRRLTPEQRAIVVLHHHLGTRSRRSRRPWAFPTGPRGPDSTTRSISCGPRLATG